MFYREVNCPINKISTVSDINCVDDFGTAIKIFIFNVKFTFIILMKNLSNNVESVSVRSVDAAS